MQPPLFVRDNRKIFRIDPVDVVCLEQTKNYTHVHVIEGDKIQRYVVRCTLTNALQKFDEALFIQINRSQVVSVNHIDTIERDEILIGINSFTITRQFYKSVIEKLNMLE